MEHLYLVCYDIRDDRRWRRLFKTMKGFGQWLQLSVFQCRLDKVRALRMEDSIRVIVNQAEDHVIIINLGPVENIAPRVQSIGCVYEPPVRAPVIV